jgi:hypothetical protein
VAVIDSGIDYSHPCFRRADGGSRILALWDQVADTVPGGTVPFGREFVADDLDRALGTADPLAVVPHEDRDRRGHGTHVAGIAAGDERGGRDTPPDQFTGIAPDAQLIVVALDTGDESLGTSTRLVAALDYVLRRAEGQPVVVNLSQGTNVGGHSGESLVERRIDELCREPGFTVVKSAGNEQQWGIHAGGQLAPGEERLLEFDVLASNRLDDIVEVWFGGGDDITVGLVPPSGPASSPVRPGGLVSFDTAAGNRVRLEVDDDADGTGDRRASLILRAGAAGQLEPGRWRIVLQAGAVADGRFEAWIERAARGAPGAPEQSRFAPGTRDPSRTVTVPGTARRVITVGSHVTKAPSPGPIGTLSAFSSLGPTRDGLPKPDLTAPGEFIVSARAGWRDGGGRHLALQGTSMAAPHVVGAAAVVLQAAPRLTGEQVGQVLRRSARTDGSTAAGPRAGWGAGKLDVAAAVTLARTAVFPAITTVQVEGAQVWVETDVATTARLQVRGPQRAVLDSGEASNNHTFDLSGLAAGPYGCSVEATAAGWCAVDDNGGHGHAVEVGTAAEQRDVPGPDDLEMISGIGRVLARRLTDAGIVTFADVAGSTIEQLAAVSGLPMERIREQDWGGQARELLTARTAEIGAAPDARERHVFTVVVLTARRDGRLVGYEVTDSRTRDRTIALDGEELLRFLREKAVASD